MGETIFYFFTKLMIVSTGVGFLIFFLIEFGEYLLFLLRSMDKDFQRELADDIRNEEIVRESKRKYYKGKLDKYN